jgi:RNA polymerase sigma-70 factor (ECF subfamily)
MNLNQGRLLNTGNNIDEHKRDAELIGRICNKDEKALELLYHHYYSRLFRFVARVIRQPELINEVINDVMYVVWGKAESYDQRCQPSTWIFGIAYNKARQLLRNSHNIEESLDAMDKNSPVLAENDAGLKQLEMDNWLEYAFDVLSPEQRAVIELTYFQGLHYSEIAKIMVCPENTVKTRMHYARKKLALIIKQ